VNLAVARKLLDRLGLEVDAAKDGRVAVDAVHRTRYDLVLMDCQMPEMDGYEATREIRVREAVMKRARLPIVAMTANAMAGDRERCFEAGMDDYLAKPLDIAQLREVLAKWLVPDQTRASPQAPPKPTPEPAPQEETVLDTKVLKNLRDAVEEDFPAIIRGFVGHAPTLMRELDEGLAANDVARLVRPAHSLKSSSASVGALRVSELAKTVEHSAREGDMGTASRGVVEMRVALADALRELEALI
jgi:CheY-like chemotaxis protein/HPt (histidine-containing phosphotransfer) domain-containing protein